MGKLRFWELLSRRQKYIFETMRRNVLSFRSFNFTPSRGYLRRPKKVQLITNPQYVQTWFKKDKFSEKIYPIFVEFHLIMVGYGVVLPSNGEIWEEFEKFVQLPKNHSSLWNLLLYLWLWLSQINGQRICEA